MSNMGDRIENSKLSEMAQEVIEDMMPFIKTDKASKLKNMTEVLAEETGRPMVVEVPLQHLLKTRKLVPKRKAPRIKRSRRK